VLGARLLPGTPPPGTPRPPLVTGPLASFLRGYQLGGGYTPAPLLALATLAGLAGTLSLARPHATPAQRHAAQACLLMVTSALTALFTHRRPADP
jgi:hypothetical protein